MAATEKSTIRRVQDDGSSLLDRLQIFTDQAGGTVRRRSTPSMSQTETSADARWGGVVSNGAAIATATFVPQLATSQ